MLAGSRATTCKERREKHKTLITSQEASDDRKVVNLVGCGMSRLNKRRDLHFSKDQLYGSA